MDSWIAARMIAAMTRRLVATRVLRIGRRPSPISSQRRVKGSFPCEKTLFVLVTLRCEPSSSGYLPVRKLMASDPKPTRKLVTTRVVGITTFGLEAFGFNIRA